MRNFNDGGRDFGSRDRGGRGGGRSFGDKQMFRATCDKCNKSCEVPFRPTGSKPIYCSDCFNKEERPRESRGFSGGRGFDRGSDRRSFGGDKQMFHAICDKCHKSCEVPFRPSGDKPVYCSDCFSNNDSRGRSEDGRPGARGLNSKMPKDVYTEQFTLINEKLDLILDAIYFEDGEEGEVEVIEKKAGKKADKKEAKTDKKVVKTEKKADKKEVEKKEEEAPAKKKAAKKAPAKKKTAAKKPAAKKAPAKKKAAAKKKK